MVSEQIEPLKTAKGVETDVEEVWRTDVEEVRKIVGRALSDNVVKKLIEWKHHH